MSTEHNPEDYVLVHKTKAKISRARKMVIGFMAVGAISALAGAGTFASFSASTTNDGVFKTGRLELSNKVNTGTACLSSDEGPGNTATADANLDANETTCDALFATDLRPGVTSTANIELHNSSTYANGKLFLFGTDDVDTSLVNACASTVNDATFRSGLKGSGDLCDNVQITVQEFSANTFANGVKLSSCVFPYSNSLSCAALTDTLDNTALLSAFPWNYDTGGNRDLGAFNTTTNTTGDRWFQISVRMPDTGFYSTGGGKDNKYQNLKPTMKLRWLLQDQ